MTDSRIKNDSSGRQVPAAEDSAYSGQFAGIGLVEACCGDLVLRGRHGMRDVLFPLHRAIARCREMECQVRAMALHGERGWDVLMDVVKEFEAKLSEACEQRRLFGIPVPVDLQLFVDRLEAGHHSII